MSIPGVSRRWRFSLVDFRSMGELRKPTRAALYLILLSVVTIAAVGALLATIVIIGQLTGSFNVSALLG